MKYTVLPVEGRLVLDLEAYHNKQVRYIGHTWNAETKTYQTSTDPIDLIVSKKYKVHYSSLFKDGDLILLSSEQ